MEDFSETKIISALTSVLQFLDRVKPLIDSHMVLFFTEQYWSTLVPEAIRREFERVGMEGFAPVLWDGGGRREELPQDCRSLAEFLRDAREMYAGSLGDVVLTNRQLKERLRGGERHGGLPSGQCMSRKKHHEVGVMAEVAAALAAASGASHVVDVGGGKGYLGSALALLHGLPVLGVDSSRGNTSSAARHSHKLQKAWRGASSTRNEERENATAAGGRYKVVTMFMDRDTRPSQLVQEHWGGAGDCRVCLVGLHACGDLSPACLGAFVADGRAAALCLVGCCYNLLGEAGLPVSRRGPRLGRNARMLAAQACHRVADTRQLAVDSLFYRALLEVLLVESCGRDARWGHVGRIAAKCGSFREYVHKATEKLGLSVQVSESRIESLYAQYLPQKDQLQAFFSLRVALAPVVETALLLDRLLYLHEQGFHKSCLVQLFDPVVSPRCYGIVSVKS
ncbi:probable methyltransferase-like protein 25 [Bacillus rossius redtenbacheri]|uniref:probable methyltransferase-like protein 25 n=1 Tax=Bacillus rossius redtenbacheri TaxID=93214 RepID=UPI002FDEAB63